MNILGKVFNILNPTLSKIMAEFCTKCWSIIIISLLLGIIVRAAYKTQKLKRMELSGWRGLYEADKGMILLLNYTDPLNVIRFLICSSNVVLGSSKF